MLSVFMLFGIKLSHNHFVTIHSSFFFMDESRLLTLDRKYMPTSLLCQVFVLLQRLHSDILILTAKSLSVRSCSYGPKHKTCHKHAFLCDDRHSCRH